jgi:hypothetical protein
MVCVAKKPKRVLNIRITMAFYRHHNNYIVYPTLETYQVKKSVQTLCFLKDAIVQLEIIARARLAVCNSQRKAMASG